MQQSIPMQYLIIMAAVVAVDFLLLPAGMAWQRKRAGTVRPVVLGAILFLLLGVVLEPLLFLPLSGGATWYISYTHIAVRSALIGMLEVAGLLLAMKLSAPKNSGQAMGIGWGIAGMEAFFVGLILLNNLLIWITFNQVGPIALQSIIVQPFPWRSYPELAASWMTADAGFSHIALSGYGVERILSLIQRLFFAGWLYNALRLSRRRLLLCCVSIFLLTAGSYYLVESIPFYAGTISYRLVSVFEMAGALVCAVAAAGYYKTRLDVVVREFGRCNTPPAEAAPLLLEI